MAHDVHLHVCIPCDTNDGVAALAKKHLELIPDEHREAKWFLEDLSNRTGNNPGPKGGLSLWGMVGNYTDEDEFVSVLTPFWIELLAGVDGGPLDHEHILVFSEHEQTEQTQAHELYIEEGNPSSLIVKKHACSFNFRQF